PSADPLELLVEHDDPPAVLATHEEEQAMEALLRDHLSPLELQAIWLRCFEGLPVPEITRLLGLTHASGARSVLQSAREKLRARLARRRAARAAATIAAWRVTARASVHSRSSSPPRRCRKARAW